MVLLKFIGCLFVILSSTGIGFLISSGFRERVEDIRLLKTSIMMLETEISYSNTPLPDAFESVSRKSSGTASRIFQYAGKSLKSRTCSTVGEAFERALNSYSKSNSLSKEDLDILSSFGYSLGSSDVEGQVKSFRLVLKQLEAQEVKAEELRGKNEKMYKSLGVLAGLAVSILLL